MPLMEHLSELRSRLIRALIALGVGMVIAWYFYPQIFGALMRPFHQAAPALKAMGIKQEITFFGIGAPFQFQMQVALLVGLIISSPIWLWQLWAFVLPALHKHEKKLLFWLSVTTIPLFIGGVALGYWILPRTLIVLASFSTAGFSNTLTTSSYLTFMVHLLLVFGVAAELPVVVVALNRIGAVSAKQLVRARPWIVVSIFVFAAVATPTPDPFTMLAVATPMTVLYVAAEIIARVSDRRRGRVGSEYGDFASEIEGPEPI
jgi:sec-independent protein translocase protein TatC